MILCALFNNFHRLILTHITLLFLFLTRPTSSRYECTADNRFVLSANEAGRAEAFGLVTLH